MAGNSFSVGIGLSVLLRTANGGHRSTVTLPYWDWTLYRDDVLKSIEDMKASEPKDNGTVPRAYRCWVDETMLNNLKGKIPTMFGAN